ncbi:MAG: hypothetical protein DRI92_03655 [Aquificota bacterium]|nr:MAG: hypothetical protein DRI92_03655 [Aquificota bacterium]
MKRVTLLAIACLLLVPGAASQEEYGVVDAQPVFRTINVDGAVNDWSEIEPAYIDTVGDSNGSDFDFAAAYIANDNEYLYIRVSFAEPAPYGDAGWLVNVVFNTDLDPSTGYSFAGLTGSEFFIQSGAVFDQRSGANFVDVFEQSADNNWGAFAFTDTAPFETTTDVEIGLRRDLTFSDDEDGMPGLINPDDAPIFEFPDFIVVFEAEDPEYNAVEFMPNADPAGETGIYYEFATGTPVESWPLH